MTLLGGQFVGQVFSASNGSDIDFELYDNSDISWDERELMFSTLSTVNVDWSHMLSFSQVAEMDNLVFISCNTDQDLQLLHRRNKYISTQMRNYRIMDVRLRYHRELFNYLVDKKIDFIEIQFNEFWEGNKFLNKIQQCMQKFDIHFDKNLITNAHKKWVYANINLERLHYEQQRSHHSQTRR
jgi:hypothetical protein